MSRYFISGKQVQLDKLIGQGGEGKVYFSSSFPTKAIKIYSDTSDSLRAKKIQRMVSLGLSGKSNLISFPEDIVTSDDGKTLGFTMNFVKDHQQVHNLYGVKSRKQFFPDVDYRFLVRVAANIARAIAQVHTYPCVIGDINHSGVLVSKNATVALIDADSFQLKDNGVLYPCAVGVPDFTPPELQMKSLRGVERTQIHDQFGLAVLIFQLLIMGRHPFHGRGRDLTQEESIAQFLFAYARNLRNGIRPPPGVPTLVDFPKAIADAFEYSFGVTGTTKRTSASEWVFLLQELENNLQKCSLNARHFYPNMSQHCPWCRMEHQTGAILFIGGVTRLSSSVTTEEIERYVAEVKNFHFDESNLFPKLPSLIHISASAEAQSSRKAAVRRGLAAKLLWVGSAICFVSMFLTGFGALLFLAIALGWLGSKVNSNEGDSWASRYIEIDNQWANHLQHWREKIIGGFFITKFNIEKAMWELKELVAQKEQKLTSIKSAHRENQLIAHLDKYLIKNAQIEHIHKSLVASLASHGIESAADIEYNKIRSIPQFGEKRTNNLVSWRRKHEQTFQYNPNLQSNDVYEQNKVINEFEPKMKEKKGYIEAQKRIFDVLRSELSKAGQSEEDDLSRIYLEKEQLKIDLKFLNIQIPPSQKVASSISKPVFSHASTNNLKHTLTTQNQMAANSPMCPKCNATMVRRWGRRGGFWGCSSYPRCRGTRNY